MSTNQTDVVGEYLREVELRVSGLPLLQRRELLADLHAHIETARAERGATSQGELIEILERLGSPDVVAAAAFEEAGPLRFASPPPQPAGGRAWMRWLIAGLVALVVVMVLSCVGFAVVGRSATSEPAPAVPAPTVT
jgi:uncharacterized membrane protein